MPRTPIWSSIAATLSGEIAEGMYLPGDKLPTEAQLATRFGVNRHTVRHALSALVAEGIVHTRRGAGAFVAHTPTDYPIGKRVRFHQNIEAAGRIPVRKLLSIETRLASAAERGALALNDEARVHACDGLSLADSQPIALFRSVFPADPFPDLPDALRSTGSVTADGQGGHGHTGPAFADCRRGPDLAQRRHQRGYRRAPGRIRAGMVRRRPRDADTGGRLNHGHVVPHGPDAQCHGLRQGLVL